MMEHPVYTCEKEHEDPKCNETNSRVKKKNLDGKWLQAERGLLQQYTYPCVPHTNSSLRDNYAIAFHWQKSTNLCCSKQLAQS